MARYIKNPNVHYLKRKREGREADDKFTPLLAISVEEKSLSCPYEREKAAWLWTSPRWEFKTRNKSDGEIIVFRGCVCWQRSTMR